ncbi:MAG: hypothetical protein HZC28_10800 [Spirochaetes bacterium]|nr:hypothetical protein [Spirochaetota bacterium]
MPMIIVLIFHGMGIRGFLMHWRCAAAYFMHNVRAGGHYDGCNGRYIVTV